MVWGPLLPSPVIRTRDVVAIQSRQRVRCRCRSRWHYAICAIFLNNILGLFYHRHIVFFTISLVKNTKCYLSKKSASEWPRNKLLARNYLLSSSKRLQLPNRFLRFLPHSETSLKMLLAQLGIDPRPRGHLHLFVIPDPLIYWNAHFKYRVYQQKVYYSWKILAKRENFLLAEYV